MPDLTEYSGDYDPSIRYQDFSKDVLADLLNAYCRELLLFDGLWFDEVRERCGEEAAFACEVAAWVKIARYEMKWAADALKIKGDSLVDFVKIMQFGGSYALGLYDYSYDFDGPNHCILTVTRCPIVTRAEKTGDVTRMKQVCEKLEPPAFVAYTQVVNPKIKTRPLKLPPRESQDAPCCVWEFVLEE